jgi:hypothetical protein
LPLALDDNDRCNRGMERLADFTRREYADIAVKDAVRYIAELAMCEGNPEVAAQSFAKRWPASPHVTLIQKTAVPGMTSLGHALVPSALATAFSSYAAHFSLLGRFGAGNVPSLQRIPFQTRLVLDDPQAAAASVEWVPEGFAKSVIAGTLAYIELARAKVCLIRSFTEELMRLAAAGSIEFLRDQLARILALGLDLKLVDETIAAAGNCPASWTNGVTPGSATDDAETDLATLTAAYVAGGGSMASAVLLISSQTASDVARSWSLLGDLTTAGGVLAGIPTLASDAVGDRIILLDSSRIYVADDGDAELSLARHAALEMSDSPTGSVATGSPTAPAATNLVSLWQSHAVALKAERYVNWTKSAGAVQWIQNVNYGAAGSPA